MLFNSRKAIKGKAKASTKARKAKDADKAPSGPTTKIQHLSRRSLLHHPVPHSSPKTIPTTGTEDTIPIQRLHSPCPPSPMRLNLTATAISTVGTSPIAASPAKSLFDSATTPNYTPMFPPPLPLTATHPWNQHISLGNRDTREAPHRTSPLRHNRG